MANTFPFSEPTFSQPIAPPAPRRRPMRVWLHALLFVITFVTCTMAGTAWRIENPYLVSNWELGLTYAILLLTFLASHEFGHYIAARIHGVDATLPFFIPIPPMLSPFGTMGAVIRTRTQIPSRKALFDIGVAGPIAGFIVCSAILAWGFTHLPPKDYLYSIHPELRQMPMMPYGLTFGKSLLYEAFAKLLVPAGAFLPPMNEIYHYPFLCVGWFGLFVTALNLIPVGQLDGGHLTYGMFGALHGKISRLTFYLLLAFGMFGVWDYLVFAGIVHGRALFIGWSGWLFWAVFVRLIIRLGHPPTPDMSPLDTRRRVIGWATIAIFIVSFAPMGIFDIPVGYPMKPAEEPKEQLQVELPISDFRLPIFDCRDLFSQTSSNEGSVPVRKRSLRAKRSNLCLNAADLPMVAKQPAHVRQRHGNHLRSPLRARIASRSARNDLVSNWHTPRTRGQFFVRHS